MPLVLDKIKSGFENTAGFDTYSVAFSSITCRYISSVSNGCKYVVHERHELSLQMEAQALRQESSKAIEQQLFENTICIQSSLIKIIIDNRVHFKKAMKQLEEKYSIKRITI